MDSMFPSAAANKTTDTPPAQDAMRFTAHLTMASAAACAVEASCLCSPRNSCKCACGRSSLLPDGQWQDGYVGEFNCGPGEGAKLPSNQNLGGGSFNWRCLYELATLSAIGDILSARRMSGATMAPMSPCLLNKRHGPRPSALSAVG